MLLESCKSGNTYNWWKPGIDKQIENMAINASGVRDTARVLKVSRAKVNAALKKKAGTL
ncbi:hypothetical protein FACS1894200_14490 [Spirochaetia bacterium]|nr:hypothetical protein FACS1894200_14490 [Spirochaetia bacterium]